MKTSPNPNTDPNFSWEDDTQELNDQDLMMIAGGESQSADPEAAEEAQQKASS